MLDRVRQYVQPDDLKLAEYAVEQFELVPEGMLPHAFVHGDLTKANVMLGDDGKIYIFDFSVANWYPRIQELAVIAANLLADSPDIDSLQQACDIVAREYGNLSDGEVSSLPVFALAAVAMEFLGAHQEKYINGIDSDETNYWMSLGRNGLQQAL